MSKVTISTMTATQDPIPQDLIGLTVETLQNLQTDLNPVPDQHLDTAYFPDNDIEPTFNADTHKKGSAILTPDPVTKITDITYNVDALDAGELADVLAARKSAKIKLLKVEGMVRIHALFPAISTWDELMLVKENWLSIAPTARTPTPKFLSLINTFVAGSDAADDINAMADVTVIDAYNVSTDPSWPT